MVRVKKRRPGEGETKRRKSKQYKVSERWIEEEQPQDNGLFFTPVIVMKFALFIFNKTELNMNESMKKSLSGRERERERERK